MRLLNYYGDEDPRRAGTIGLMARLAGKKTRSTEVERAVLRYGQY
jgi:hypothetical protein